MRAVLIAIIALTASASLAGDTDSDPLDAPIKPSVDAVPDTPMPLLPVCEPPESPPEVTEWVEMPNGLKYADLKVGTGMSPRRGQTVTVEYSGWVADSGSRFDSSYGRAAAFQFTYGGGQVILGWEKGLKDMKTGGRRVLLIPAYLGYGASGAGDRIPPHADLIFDVELLATQ